MGINLKNILQTVRSWDERKAVLSGGVAIALLILVLGYGRAPQAAGPGDGPNPFTDARVVLPVVWGDLGQQLAAKGVIDKQKLAELYKNRGGIPPEMVDLLESSSHGELVMTPENSGYLLNLLWALGLGNRSPVYEEGGPLGGPDAGDYASTGGWGLATGDAMDHLGKYDLIPLTEEQTELVKRVTENIYRPCCGNSTYFPDCNHGMAMLALMQLMAANGATEDEMYRVALKVNALWFTDTYATIARYLHLKGRDPRTADPKEILGADYSGGLGFRKIAAEVPPDPNAPRQSASCGV